MVGAAALREDDMGEIERVSERLARAFEIHGPSTPETPSSTIRLRYTPRSIAPSAVAMRDSTAKVGASTASSLSASTNMPATA